MNTTMNCDKCEKKSGYTILSQSYESSYCMVSSHLCLKCVNKYDWSGEGKVNLKSKDIPKYKDNDYYNLGCNYLLVKGVVTKNTYFPKRKIIDIDSDSDSDSEDD